MQYRFSIKYKFFFLSVLQVQINLKHMEPPCWKSCAFNGHYTVHTYNGWWGVFWQKEAPAKLDVQPRNGWWHRHQTSRQEVPASKWRSTSSLYCLLASSFLECGPFGFRHHPRTIWGLAEDCLQWQCIPFPDRHQLRQWCGLNHHRLLESQFRWVFLKEKNI